MLVSGSAKGGIISWPGEHTSSINPDKNWEQPFLKHFFSRNLFFSFEAKWRNDYSVPETCPCLKGVLGDTNSTWNRNIMFSSTTWEGISSCWFLGGYSRHFKNMISLGVIWLLRQLQHVLRTSGGRFQPVWSRLNPKITAVNMCNLSPNQVETRTQQLEVTNKRNNCYLWILIWYHPQKMMGVVSLFVHLPVGSWKCMKVSTPRSWTWKQQKLVVWVDGFPSFQWLAFPGSMLEYGNR